MKKSTLAIAALITTLSTAIIMPAAYADDATSPAPTESPAPDATPMPDVTPDAPATDAPAASDDSGS